MMTKQLLLGFVNQNACFTSSAVPPLEQRRDCVVLITETEVKRTGTRQFAMLVPNSILPVCVIGPVGVRLHSTQRKL